MVISKNADATLASTGSSKAKERVIPITHVGGTWDSPKIELDEKALAAVGSAYLSNPKVQKKLEKTLGPGGSEAVQGVLDELLGGGSKKKGK